MAQRNRCEAPRVDRQRSGATCRGRRAGCHADFIGFHRAFRTFSSSPVRIFKPVKNLLDRGFPFRTLNGIDVWETGKPGAAYRRGRPAARCAAGRNGGWGKRAAGRLPCAAGAPRRSRHVTSRSVPAGAGRRRSHRRASAARSVTGAPQSASPITSGGSLRGATAAPRRRQNGFVGRYLPSSVITAREPPSGSSTFFTSSRKLIALMMPSPNFS